MTWQMRTLKDTLIEPYPVNVSCGCGRLVHPDMAADVSAFTPQERISKGWDADTAYVCDSCLSMAERTGAVKLSELYERQGAPADVLTAVRAYEATL